MKRIFLGAAILAGFLCAPATAQDWSGWYAGAEFGFSPLDFKNATQPGESWPLEGKAIGVTVGYWSKADLFYFGWDGNIGLGGPHEDFARDTPILLRSYFGQDAYASVRAKLGLEFGSGLVYVGAGPMVSHNYDHFQQAAAVFDDDTVAFGATLAVGLEVPLNDRLGIFGEYRFNTTYPTLSASSVGFPVAYTFFGSEYKAGLNYHFD